MADKPFSTSVVKEGEKTFLLVKMQLSKPCPENRSKGEGGERNGKTFVIGKAWGKLPFSIGGKIVKLNATVMIPVDDHEKGIEEVVV